MASGSTYIFSAPATIVRNIAKVDTLQLVAPNVAQKVALCVRALGHSWALYECGGQLNLGPPNTNPFSGREEVKIIPHSHHSWGEWISGLIGEWHVSCAFHHNSSLLLLHFISLLQVSCHLKMPP